MMNFATVASLSLILTYANSAWVNHGPELTNTIGVNKCCEENELYIGKYCTPITEVNETLWKPIFTTEDGRTNIQILHRLVVGRPDCGSKEKWPIYHYQNSTDRLRLLPNGVLRHYYDHKIPPGEEALSVEMSTGKDSLYYDYEPGKYCLDKKVDGAFISEFAWVCPPDHQPQWTSMDQVMRNLVSPMIHVFGIIHLLIVAIIYFVMPTLRDLVGNIITTICMCLIVNQSANLIRLLTVFNSHISLIIADTICYTSSLGAFFWLNSLGYYIWKTFKSRNVFLRITDGKKYCYYSAYSWSCTIILGVLAVFAHFTMDYPQNKPKPSKDDQQEEIGSLGIIIFFVPIAFTILIDIFFFVSTLKTINRMHTYGRIHHKLRHSFRMFFLLLLIMTVTWLFFLLSFFKIEGFTTSYVLMNTILGPYFLHVCVFNQKHVAYLVRKTCCPKNYPYCSSCQSDTEGEWGDEMRPMDTTIY